MRRSLHRRQSRSARIAQALGFFAVVLTALNAAAFRFGQIDILSAALVYGFAVVVALLAMLFAALALRALWIDGAKGGMASVRALLLAGLVLAPLGYGTFASLTLPRLNDVATDWADPPRFPLGSRLEINSPLAAPAPPEDVGILQAEAYPDIVTRVYGLSLQLVQKAVERTAAEMRWQATSRSGNANGAEGLLFAYETRTPVLGFSDDVVVRLRQDGDDVAVDIRSAGRYGQHDLGNHARRIRSFFSVLEKQLKNVQAE